MAEEILERLGRSRSRMDLLISVPDSVAAERAQSNFGGYSKGRVDVRVFNNRGRDIGPFLTGFGQTILNGYDIVGHLHTKKSDNPGINAESMTEVWRRFLYANLLADKEVIADTIIQRFAAEDSIGLVFPDDPNIIGWGENLPFALDVAKQMGITTSTSQNNL